MLVPTLAEAQKNVFNNYTPLTSKGQLPPEFAVSATQKYIESKKSISKKEKRSIRKSKTEFYLKNSFSIDELLRSGKVLFNDTVGIYVDQVFQKILKVTDISPSSVKVFIVKTNYSNAFATDQGLIFVTTGLLARLQNEAQLAYVLCHELVHVKEKHVMDVYLHAEETSQKIKKATDEYELEPAILSHAAFSKDKETEADIKGLQLYIKTGYAVNEVVALFDILQFAQHPFDSLPFNRDFFGNGKIAWSNRLFVKTVDRIEYDSEEDESLTHPNTPARKLVVSKIIDSLKVAGFGSDFLISQDQFNFIRQVCRFEYCRNALLQKDYCNAIYAAYTLLHYDPDNLYLKKTIGKALYALSMYAIQGRKKEVVPWYFEVQGNVQQVHAFARNSYAYEVNALAVKYLYDLNKQFPNDREIAAILDETFSALTYYHIDDITLLRSKVLPDSLQSGGQSIYADESYSDMKEQFELATGKFTYNHVYCDENTDIKYRKIRILYAFADYLNDTGFVKMFERHAFKSSQIKSHVDSVLVENSISEDKPEYMNDTRPEGEINTRCYNYYIKRINAEAHDKKAVGEEVRLKYTGLFNNKLNKSTGEKVILLNPLYYSLDLRKKNPLKYVASESARNTFINRLKISADAANLPYELLSENEISITDAELLNRISLLKEWMSEQFSHGEATILPTDYELIKNLSESLGTRYLCLFGNTFSVLKKDRIEEMIFYSIIIPFYSWVITVPYFLIKKIETMHYFIALDLEKGKIVTAGLSTVKSGNNEDISLATLYNFMLKIKLYQEVNR